MFEFINAVRENFQRKLKTPLLGMFLGVFFVHNWRLFLYPFFWDKDLSLYTKQAIYTGFFENARNPLNLLEYLGISVIAVMTLYVVMSISKAIVLVFENIVLPFLHKHIQGKVVTIEAFNHLKTFSDDLKKEYDSKKAEFAEKIGEAKKLSEKVSSLEDEKVMFESKQCQNEQRIDEIEEELKRKSGRLKETELQLQLTEIVIKHSKNNVLEIVRSFQELRNEVEFINLVSIMRNKKQFSLNKGADPKRRLVAKLVDAEAIKVIDKSEETFELTEYGRDLFIVFGAE